MIDIEWYRQPDGLIPVWATEFMRLQHHVEAALEYSQGTHDAHDVLEQIAKGELQLWPGKDTVVITQIITFPKKKTLHVFLAGGNQKELKELDPFVVEWAKEQGCSALTFTGRMGWARSEMKEIGFETTHVMMSKDI